MVGRRAGMVLGAAAIAVGGLGVSAPPASARGGVFTARLTGSQVVPGPGDPDGIGGAGVRVDTATGLICYGVGVAGVDFPAVVHIHRGRAGQTGPIVVPLADPQPDGHTAGCTPNLGAAQAIAADPSGYYVNYHTVKFPSGAIRGQLG